VCSSVVPIRGTPEILQSPGMGESHCIRPTKYYWSIKITFLRPLLAWEEENEKIRKQKSMARLQPTSVKLFMAHNSGNL
jgi:hypothetical protein